MRLSEAIVLGSTVLTPRAGSFVSPGREGGCALGMAAFVVGCTFAPPIRQIRAKDRRTLNSEDIWGAWILSVVMRPCECSAQLPCEMRIKDIIAHLFDDHVMEKKDWTLDQLAAWVDAWEPKNSVLPEPLGSEFLQELSRLKAAHERQSVSESGAKEEREGVDEWQAQVSAFAARYGSGRKRRTSV